MQTIDNNFRGRSKLQNYLSKENINNQYVFSKINLTTVTAPTSTRYNIYDGVLKTKETKTTKKSIIIEYNKNEAKIISNKSTNSSNRETEDQRRFQVMFLY